MNDVTRNIDPEVAAGFGHEWSTFRQTSEDLSAADREAIFQSYFHIFLWNESPPDPVGIDVGYGSGRWSVMVAPKVGHIQLLDASADAIAVARRNLAGATNVDFHLVRERRYRLPDTAGSHWCAPMM
jgi:methylase of polypeptide subunit release factors